MHVKNHWHQIRKHRTKLYTLAERVLTALKRLPNYWHGEDLVSAIFLHADDGVIVMAWLVLNDLIIERIGPEWRITSKGLSLFKP